MQEKLKIIIVLVLINWLVLTVPLSAATKLTELVNDIRPAVVTVIAYDINQKVTNIGTGFFIDKYTLSYRYRFNALREWLFFEIEPFIEWPKDENFTTTPGIALRIEGFFSKK